MSGNLELRGDGRLPEEAALADQLCALFDSLGVSYRRYAAGRPYDHSTVYRYLKGERPPTWGFIHDLLYAVAEAQGSTPTAEAIGLFRKLHNDVLKAGNSPQHKVLLLEHQLADAHKKARQAAVREQWLEQAVEEHQGRIRNLEIGQREPLNAAAGRRVPPSSSSSYSKGGDPSHAHGLRYGRGVRLQANGSGLRRGAPHTSTSVTVGAGPRGTY